MVWPKAKKLVIDRDTDKNLLANTLHSLYNKINGVLNTNFPSESFVCGSGKKNESVEVLNISKAEKSPITSSVIDFVCADVEGQSAKQNCKFRIVHGDAEVCNRCTIQLSHTRSLPIQ